MWSCGSDTSARLAALALLWVVAWWAAAGCGLPTREEVLAGKACDPSGACASGYQCDLASNICVPEGSLTAQGGGGSGGGGSGGDGGGGHGGDGGTPMMTGGGGDAPCMSLDDCPIPVNPCEVAFCLSGDCGIQPATAGTPILLQTPGDCRLEVCDGFGNIVFNNNDGDMPDDGNACTSEVCNNGDVDITPNAIGSSCSIGGSVCDGAGSCVACNTPSDCTMLPADDQCQTRTCQTGVCGQSFAMIGTPLLVQDGGDCHLVGCDGNGGTQLFIDDNDLPVDGKECTFDMCNNGTPSNPNQGNGASCSAGTCDGNGNCTSCTAPIECGSDSFCRQHTCTTSVCGTIDTDAGTPLPSQDQIANDCQELQCDGVGVVEPIADDGDVPVDDGNDCTEDACSNGVAQHPNKPLDAVCSSTGIVCDGAGSCVACNSPGQCPQGSVCQTALCSSHNCSLANTPNGTPAPSGAQTAGDCQVVLCNGTGGTTTQVNNSDVPVDGNDCTNDVCTSGVPSNPNWPNGTSCQNGTGTCNGGQCSALKPVGDPCNAGAECISTNCVDGVCCIGACGNLCAACAASLTGQNNGTCAFIPTGQDPNQECSAAAVCNGAGACFVCNDHVLSQAYGGDTLAQRATGVAVDGSGNIIVAGFFRGTVDFGGGPIASEGTDDVFVVKLAPNGAHVWSRGYGGAANDQALGVAVNANGAVAVTGFYRSSDLDFGGGDLGYDSKDAAFVLKLDAAGNHVWSKGYTSPDDRRGTGVDIDGGGDVYAVGLYDETGIDFGGGTLNAGGDVDLFVARLASADGAHVWSEGFGGADDQIANAVALDGAGDVLVVGQWQTSLNFGGGALTSQGGFDVFVAKLDGATGAHAWSDAYGSSGDQFGYDVAVDGQDAVIFTGAFQNSVDFGGGALVSPGGKLDVFLAKLDMNGVHVWSKRYGSVDDQTGRSVAVDSQDDIVVGGEVKGSADFGGGTLTATGASLDIFLAKVDATGAHECSQLFGGANDQFLTGVDVDSARNAVLAGYFFGSVTFGMQPHVATSSSDAYVAKRTP